MFVTHTLGRKGPKYMSRQLLEIWPETAKVAVADCVDTAAASAR